MSSSLTVFSFLIYGIKLELALNDTLTKRIPYMTSSLPSREKCVIYGPKTVLGQSLTI